jgi:hypothetical protein
VCSGALCKAFVGACRINVAAQNRPIFHREAPRKDIADDHRTVAQFHAAGSPNLTFQPTQNDDFLGKNGCTHDTFGANRESRGGQPDHAVDLAISPRTFMDRPITVAASFGIIEKMQLLSAKWTMTGRRRRSIPA